MHLTWGNKYHCYTHWHCANTPLHAPAEDMTCQTVYGVGGTQLHDHNASLYTCGEECKYIHRCWGGANKYSWELHLVVTLATAAHWVDEHNFVVHDLFKVINTWMRGSAGRVLQFTPRGLVQRIQVWAGRRPQVGMLEIGEVFPFFPMV